MTILIVGATGLVGGHVVAMDPNGDLHALTRRPHNSALAETVAPPEDWPALVAKLKPDIVISTLGTTIRQAGSQTAFRAVDHDLVLGVAAAARGAGTRQFILVTSVGASPSSSNFYLKTKGEAEAGVTALDFDRIDILRPGLLTGDRAGPTRWGEAIAIMVSPFTDLLTPAVLSQYRSIKAQRVAEAIAALCGASEGGTHIHHNPEIERLASKGIAA